jgi:hypothetical protein
LYTSFILKIKKNSVGKLQEKQIEKGSYKNITEARKALGKKIVLKIEFHLVIKF